MKRVLYRGLAATLALMIAVSAPGSAAYQAAGRAVRARSIGLPGNPSPSAAAASGLNRRPVLTLESVRATRPDLPGRTSAVQSHPRPGASPAPYASPQFQIPASAVPAAPIPALPTAQAQVPMLPGAYQDLARTGISLESARARTDPASTRMALDRLFQDSRPIAADPSPSASRMDTDPAAPQRAAALEPAGPRGPPQTSGPSAPQSDPPQRSLGRSLHVGCLAAAITLAANIILPLAAQFLGYELHPDYRGITLMPTWIGAARNLTEGVILAPIAEEALFRGVLMGGLGKLTRRIPYLGDFWLPALASSAVFVWLHETSDPVLILTRLLGSMVLCRVFHKENLPAAIAAHSFFNAFLILASLGSMLKVDFLATVMLISFGAAAAIWSSLRLLAQKPDRRAGRILPFSINATQALFMQAALLLGFFLLLPNPIWMIGAMAYFIYALWLQWPRVSAWANRVKNRLTRILRV